jgi:RHS repeat-associated protein
MKQTACRTECRPCQLLPAHSRGRIPARPCARQRTRKAPDLILTDGNGHTTTWERDLQGRIVAKVTPDGARTTYEFDTAGRQTTRTDALGQTRTFAYDQANAITRIAYGNAVNPTPEVSYTWDAWYSRLNAMTDGTGTTQYRYMQAGAPGALQLQSEDGPFENDFHARSYDALGRLQSWYVGLQTSESLTFDALGRVIATKNPALGNFKYSYLGDTGQLTRAILNGKPIEYAFTYEDNTGDRRLKSIANPASALSFGYTSAPENLITRLTESAQGQSRAWDYGYDAIDRLQSADRSDGAQYDYVLDLGDNLTGIVDPEGTRTWTHDAGNKIAQAPYQYDANGNRIEDDKHTYQWDAENRLIQIGYKAEPQRSTEFKYDGQSRRVAIIEKLAGATTRETRYTWCGETICQARDGNDQPLAYYFSEGTFRPTPGTPVSKLLGEREYYAKDHLGSVRDVLDQQGNVTASFDYDPYGRLTNSPATTPEFGYAGMQYHAPSGLYLTKYRAYEPKTGRWLSRDPIEEAGGINLYAYVEGNPVSRVDPTGLLTATVGVTVRIPGWLGWLIPGYIGQGGNAGIAVQITDKCGNFSPDLGLYWGGSAGGGDFGIGRGAINLGLHSGTIGDLAGSGHDVSGHWGMFGGTGYWNGNGQFSGASFDIGPGYNIGISGSVGGSWSFGGGVSTK